MIFVPLTIEARGTIAPDAIADHGMDPALIWVAPLMTV
jgi:hypothetical protein